uniref:S-protein homolog n=1 Tax=Lotus japonicus TaxID=34305 RepID=I3SS90_LOTJA|nr:unknown [Lotus japonicus]
MSLFHKSVLLLCLLLPVVNSAFWDKVHVRVTNYLEGELDLTLHCKSKDDDLGVKVLHQDQFYEFSFRPNFWGTTLFHCSFQWQHVTKRFDIFKDHRDYDGYFFYWTIQQDGPCVFDKPNGFLPLNCFPWNPK